MAIATIRPTLAALSDDSDLTKEQIGTVGEVRVYEHGDLSLSGSITQVRVRVRNQMNTGSATADIGLDLGGSRLMTRLNVTTTTAERLGAWHTTRPGGGAWTWADINNLRGAASSGISPTYTHMVYEMYIDVDYNQPPSAPGAFTDPTSGEVHDASVPYAHGAGSDPEGGALTYERQYTVNNGSTWTALADATTTSGTLDSSGWAATTTARLRVRSKDGAGNVSAWTESPTFTIEHNKAPNAPPIVGPKNNVVLDRTQQQVFDWDFSDPDAGDSQSQYQRQYRVAGGTTWTVEAAVTSTATQRTDAANFWAAGDWEWQVRTADAQGVWGPFSASAFFTAADPPAAPSITDPANGATIASESGQVVWSTPSQGSFQVRKVKDNAGSPDATTIYYDSGEIVSTSARNHGLTFPVNDRTEHIQVRIKSSGLWSAWASVRVVVSYTPPAVPTFTLSPTPESGLIALTIDNGAWPVSVGTVTYTGTGTGTMTGPTATDGVTQSHNWTATLVTAAANGGTFDVAVDGVVVGQAVVGTQFIYEGLSFTINDGATDFAVGDKFSWATTAVKTNSNHILRRRSGELEWERIATEIAANSTYNDRTPASEIVYEYLVRAIGDNGTSSDSAISSASVTLRFMWLHLANDPAGTIRQFQFNNSGGTEIHTEEVEFLTFAGRKYPVAEFGEHETDSVVVDLDLAEEGELAYIRSLIRARSTICYRDSSGRKLFGIIPQQSIDSRFYGGTTSLEIRAIDYSEEV